jgi:hypothetical protein
MWTLLNQAQASPRDDSHAALVALIERYQGVAYRYLLGTVRNPDVADESARSATRPMTNWKRS